MNPEKFVLGVAELGVLRILNGKMSRDRIERTVIRLELSKFPGSITDAIESLIKKRLVQRVSKKKPSKSTDDFVKLTHAGKALRTALIIGKFI